MLCGCFHPDVTELVIDGFSADAENPRALAPPDMPKQAVVRGQEHPAFARHEPQACAWSGSRSHGRRNNTCLGQDSIF